MLYEYVEWLHVYYIIIQFEINFVFVLIITLCSHVYVTWILCPVVNVNISNIIGKNDCLQDQKKVVN